MWRGAALEVTRNCTLSFLILFQSYSKEEGVGWGGNGGLGKGRMSQCLSSLVSPFRDFQVPFLKGGLTLAHVGRGRKVIPYGKIGSWIFWSAKSVHYLLQHIGTTLTYSANDLRMFWLIQQMIYVCSDLYSKWSTNVLFQTLRWSKNVECYWKYHSK